ncbi:hypothetical protein Efla_005435 [Eimeria flavescens]
MKSDLALLTATRLYSAISADASKVNFVFSPYSILGVFHMAQRGAAGDTKKEMDGLLPPDAEFRFSVRRRAEETVVIDAANRLYVGKSLESSECFLKFSRKLEAEMGSEAKTVDFSQPEAAAREMNDFVKRKTRDHITNLIDASMVSETPWSSQFKPEQTFQGVFHARTHEGWKEQKVKFMKQELKNNFSYIQEAGVTAFSMGYADDRLRMFVYMPEDLQSFESKVADNPEHLQLLAARLLELGCQDSVLNLEFPKFKLSASDNSVDLAPIFRSLGAAKMLDQQQADFSEITGARDLWVSGFVHQADIDVNEEGTEATAATAMLISTLALPAPKPVISLSLNKPFLFQVRIDEEGRCPLILFTGRIADAAVSVIQQPSSKKNKTARSLNAKILMLFCCSVLPPAALFSVSIPFCCDEQADSDSTILNFFLLYGHLKTRNRKWIATAARANCGKKEGSSPVRASYCLFFSATSKSLCNGAPSPH